jgi:DNA ligase (NAD+)
MTETKVLIEQLNKSLVEAQNAYYGSGTAEISDAEYDIMEAQLMALVKANPEFAPLATALNKVGDSEKTSTRAKHIRPMLSIENKYAKNDVVDFFLHISGAAFQVEPKRDGISCELRYVDGVLTQALTRGDGVSGEDMTPQVLALKSIPKRIGEKFPKVVHLRGELVMRVSELERINKEAQATGSKTYMSTRNLTAGTMKQKDLSVVASRHIEFVPWDIYSPDADHELPDSAIQRLNRLQLEGFFSYDGLLAASHGLIEESIDLILERNRQSDILADGVVVKVDSHKLRRELGVSSKFTNYQCCFKPQSASNTTVLREVVWQVGRQGKLTPVAECDAVELAGAIVTRATLNNISWIKTMKLKTGAKVRMLRSGDVIPQIVEVLDTAGEEIVPPPFCPECIQPLEVLDEGRTGIITHWCQNVECPGRVRDTLSFIGSRDILEIDGLADDMAKRLASEGYARNIAELFTFQTEAKQSIEKVGEDKFAKAMAKKGFSVTIIKMVNSIESAKTATWDRWIAALGIPMIGRTLGKVLATHLKLTPESMLALPELLLKASAENIEGMGAVKSSMLRKWAEDPSSADTCKALTDAGVRPTTLVTTTVNGEPLKGVAFVITGEFSEDRDTLTRKLMSLGAVEKSGVSKNMNLLIVGELPGKSKLAKYSELVAKGVKIEKVGREWLEKTFSENGIEFKSGMAMVEEA